MKVLPTDTATILLLVVSLACLPIRLSYHRAAETFAQFAKPIPLPTIMKTITLPLTEMVIVATDLLPAPTHHR